MLDRASNTSDSEATHNAGLWSWRHHRFGLQLRILALAPIVCRDFSIMGALSNLAYDVELGSHWGHPVD
ncbi:hypothetical protein PGTUg99_021921 [Puccinia graminis f. sp. tritici]|uniref:Uncharacterized protein n=1 Tax=Puccinia graminis f. sp. tritici TaxID=56615 RepID=A0A5B0P3X7_PUCGR|nr:hypothetical protein PGTUg99_021921 [Puccinia graminis f. sp. tritici]